MTKLFIAMGITSIVAVTALVLGQRDVHQTSVTIAEPVVKQVAGTEGKEPEVEQVAKTDDTVPMVSPAAPAKPIRKIRAPIARAEKGSSSKIRSAPNQNADQLALSQAAPLGSSEVAVTSIRSFGLRAEVEISSSLHEPESASYEAETVFTLIPSIGLSESLRLSARMAVTNNLENERETTLSNTKLTLAHSAIPLTEMMSFAPSLAATAPTSKVSRLGDSLIAAVHLQPKLLLDLGIIGLSGANLTNHLSLTRNFHEFETARTGKANTEYSVSNTFEAAYALTEKFELSASFKRGVGWTYGGSPKNNFGVGQSLSFAPDPSWSVAVSHLNSGAAFRENGIDSNLSLFDGNDSRVSGSLTFIY